MHPSDLEAMIAAQRDALQDDLKSMGEFFDEYFQHILGELEDMLAAGYTGPVCSTWTKGGDKWAYDTLGVDRHSSDEEVRKAYIRKAKEYHPDKGGATADMTKLNAAYSKVYRSRRRL